MIKKIKNKLISMFVDWSIRLRVSLTRSINLFRFLSRFHWPIGIMYWTGRFGNNIQQVCVAILYARKHNCPFLLNLNHPQIKKFSYPRNVINRGFAKVQSLLYSEIFFWNQPPTKLDYQYIADNMQEVAQQFIVPNLKFSIGQPLDD